MAQYTVTYSCGHTGTVSLFGKHEERERTLARMSKTQLCEECRKADLAEKNTASAESNKAAGLPALTGSANQVDWAETIRHNAWQQWQSDKAIINLLHDFANRARTLDVTPEMIKAAGYNTPDKANILMRECVKQVFHAHHEAKYWIDNRETECYAVNKEIVRRFAAAVQAAAQNLTPTAQQQDAMTPLQLPSNTRIPLELPQHAKLDATPEPAQAEQPQQQTITPDIREIDPHAPMYIQSRAQMDFALVDEYAQMMRDGVEFDPAQAIEDADGKIYVFDGYHRGEAAKAAGVMLRVRVQSGTRADAEWLAFAANKSHGLRRTHADIERVVRNALAHPNAAGMSDRELARHCGTDHKTVGNWRKRLAADAMPPAERERHESDTATQTEIAGTEKPEYTLSEIREIVEDYLPKDAIDRASMLNNLISKTVAGQAYQREIDSLLRSNPMRSCKQLDASLRVVYGLIINTLPSDNSGGAGLDALTVLQVEHNKIATTFEDTAAIEANAGEADETPTAQRAQAEAVLADAQAYLTATKPQPEAAPRPVEIEQIRCVGCRELYPADQVTYRTGLCQACLAHQLNQLAADYHMMRAVFAVLDRALVPGHAAEIKQAIYEEIYKPKQPREVQCEECKGMFDISQLVTYNGRKLHADCYYAAVSAYNALYEQKEQSDDMPPEPDDAPPDPRDRVLYYKQQGLSVRKIADALKAEGITMSKSAVDRIVQEQKETQP